MVRCRGVIRIYLCFLAGVSQGLQQIWEFREQDKDGRCRSPCGAGDGVEMSAVFTRGKCLPGE